MGTRMIFWVVGGKYKNGTCWFHRYATIEIISQKNRLTLFALPYHNFSNKKDIVKTLIERTMRYVEIELVMLDRGFFFWLCDKGIEQYENRFPDACKEYTKDKQIGKICI